MSLYAFIYNIYLSIYISFNIMTWSQAGEIGGVLWTRFFPTNQPRVEFSSGQSLSMPALPPWSGKAWDMLMLLRVHTNRNKPNYPNISKLHSYIVDGQATPAHCEQSWTIWKFRTPFRLPIYEAHQLFNAGLDSLLELHTAVRCCVASILTMTRLRQWRSINICHMLFSYVPYG